MILLDPEREAELLRCARDERTRSTATAELVRALREPVLALCASLTRNRAEAEDATQETLLALHRGLPGFRGDARLSTWVYRIAIRMALHVRARRADGAAIPEWLPDPAPGPEQQAQARQRDARLAVALEALSPEQRLVLGLFAVEGLRHGEIAEILGVPEGTVWSRLHLARKRLLALLEE